MTSRSLYEHSIPLSPRLAEHLGSIPQALILQQLHYWLTDTGCRKREGVLWVAKPVGKWVEELVIYNEKTIRRALDDLCDLGIVVASHYGNLRDRTKWYRIDYSKLPSFGQQALIHSDKVSKSLIEEDSLFKTQAKPSASPPETLVIRKVTPVKTPTSAALVLASLKEKKGTIRPPKISGTPASAMAIWRNEVPKLEGVGFLPSFTVKQQGQFRHFVTRCGPTSDALITYIVSNWIGFTKFVANAKALKKTPDRPDIAFLLLYVHEARDFHATALQLVAPAAKKPSILGKPVKTRPPVVASSTIATVSETETVPVSEKEDVASLEDILAWTPVKKE